MSGTSTPTDAKDGSTSTTTTTTVVDLRLDGDDADDEPEEHPRRLLEVDREAIVAYGGNFGKIVSAATGRVVRTTEEAIRAVAANRSGTRVAVGMDSGESVLYAYEPDLVAAATAEGGAGHPFAAVASSGAESQGDHKDDDDDVDRFLSQGSYAVLSGPRKGEARWEASQDDDAMRDYAWLDDGTTLLCASEKRWYWLDCSTETSCLTKHEAPELDAAHSGSGIRSLALNQDQTVLITLDMEGRACWWKPTKAGSGGGAGPQWTLLHREATKCVSRKDVGEVFGSSSWCRSSRPLFVTPKVAALPGEPFLQLRRVDDSGSVEVFDQVVETGDGGAVQGHVQAIVTMCSRDGYLVTSGRDGRVVAWDIQETNGAVSSKFLRLIGEYESAPTDLLWRIDPSTKEESLLIITAKGQLVTIRGRENIAPVRGSGKRKGSRIVNDEKARAKPTSDSSEKVDVAVKPTTTNDGSDGDNLLGRAKPSEDAVNADHREDDDDSLFGSPGNADSPPSSKAPKKNRFIDDEAADDDDDDADDDIDSVSGRPRRGSPVRTRDPTEEPGSPMAGDNRDYDDDEDDDDIEMPPPYVRHGPPPHATLKLPEPQAPFVPSSTPLDLTRRFLCWNHVGSVTRLLSDDGRTLVDIDFTDSAFRRPISFTDNLGFVLGSLGEDGGIFCTDLLEDGDSNPEVDALLHGLSEATKLAVKKSHQSRMRGGNKGKPTGSSIYFHRFESTVGNMRDKDWHLTLPNDERALGCACGEGWAAVVTSRRFLRLYSSGGNQGRVHWLPGEPVTMAGRSRFLVVVYHEESPLADGTQKLGYVFMDAQSQGRILHKGSLACVSKASALTWIGLSNDHSVMAMDSDGMLSMLASTGSAAGELDSKTSLWEWMPVLDTVGLRRTAEDSFWPITVYDGKLVCAPLKGGTRHPDATRRPVTTSLSFRLPLARGSLIQANPLEELSIRAGIALNQKRILHDVTSEAEDQDFENEFIGLSAQVDKVTLKMFASIVEAGKLERALDLVERLHLEKSYDLAMTIADQHRKLVDRIEEVKDRRFGSDYVYGQTGGDEGYDHEEQDDQEPSHITPDSTVGRKRALQQEPMSAIARMIRRKQGIS